MKKKKKKTLRYISHILYHIVVIQFIAYYHHLRLALNNLLNISSNFASTCSLRKIPKFHLISQFGKTVFLQNFHTRKLGEITVFYAVFVRIPNLSDINGGEILEIIRLLEQNQWLGLFSLMFSHQCCKTFFENLQKQPFRGVLKKRCSENMQQIYRIMPCRSVISIKLLYIFLKITLRHGCSPVNLLHIFQHLFLKKTLGGLLLNLLQTSLLPSLIFPTF